MKPLNIFGKKVEIEYHSDLENDGEYLYDYHLIKINKSLSKEQKELTLIHEIIHATFHRVGLRQATPNELEEVIAETIAHALYENFNLKRK